MDNRFPLDSDAPIDGPTGDRLGFGELARHLADVFLRKDLSRGLVVGIEGEWGSGKSSLANLAFKAVENEREEQRPRIVRFSPWIIGNRNELLRQLFLQLGSALPDEYNDTRTLLDLYAQSASILAVASALDAPEASILTEWFSRLPHWIRKLASKAAAPSLSRQRYNLREKFRNHEIRVVVFIDDIDRQEPKEAVEVLRLVRAVADFPNVDYVLAYDPLVLAKSLQTALGVENGYAYIEKIVQASFAIPNPMGFDLRSWLAEETKAIFDRADLAPEANERLERSLSCWCSEYISTPRHVVRTVNALKLHVAPLAGRLDPADGLFIQMIRVHHPELYDWVQRYLMKKFATDPNDYHLAWKEAAEDTDDEQESKLAQITRKQGNTLLQFLDDLRQHLPQVSIPDSPSPPAFGAEEREQYATARRLNSSSYFRLYFALSLPAGFLSDEEVSAFLDMCFQDREAAVRHFRERCQDDRLQGGNMAQVLLSRILERKEDISADWVAGLFEVLGDSMDHFARQLPDRPGNPPYLYGDAMDVFELFRCLDMEKRMETLLELFANAKSLAWLNSIAIDAIIEHGFAGHQASPVEQRLLTQDEFECVRVGFLKRLEGTDAEDLKKTPFFLSLLYGWHWAGGEAKAWVQNQSSSNKDFIDLLGRMMSIRRVSHGRGTKNKHVLERKTLEMFFGSIEIVTSRLDAIRYGRALPQETLEEAERLFLSIPEETPR